jgi:hypothetical protein
VSPPSTRGLSNVPGATGASEAANARIERGADPGRQQSECLAGNFEQVRQHYRVRHGCRASMPGTAISFDGRSGVSRNPESSCA